MPKVKKTVWAVLAFIALTLYLLWAEEAQAHDSDGHHSVSIGVSGGIVNYPSGVTQTIGYTYGGRWNTEYERLGGKGYSTVNGFSVVRIIEGSNPHGLGATLGVTYFDRALEERDRPGKAIVSDTLTYRLGIHYSWKISSSSVIRFGILHNSTAGRSDKNKGIDRLNLSYIWRI